MRANAGSAASSSCLLDHGETFDAGIDQEALEPGHAGCRQGRKVFLVLPGQSTPGRPVHAALAGGRVTLGFERSNRGGFRQAIERHIHQRGVAAGRGGAGGGGEAFPFRPARFVDVHMRIHQAGQQHQVAELMQLRLRAVRLRAAHRLNASLLDDYRCRPHALGRDHAAGDKRLCHTSDIRAALWRVQAKSPTRDEHAE